MRILSVARWSWYLRLPGPRTHGWAGVVRCEMAAGSHLPIDAPKAAGELADIVSATLPRYASEPHKENRAPQNLYPIKGLEHALRRKAIAFDFQARGGGGGHMEGQGFGWVWLHLDHPRHLGDSEGGCNACEKGRRSKRSSCVKSGD